MQVKDKTTWNIFAIKILRKKQVVASNQVEHTRAERKILEALQHPFLMKLRYAFKTFAKLYLLYIISEGWIIFPFEESKQALGRTNVIFYRLIKLRWRLVICTARTYYTAIWSQRISYFTNQDIFALRSLGCQRILIPCCLRHTLAVAPWST